MKLIPTSYTRRLKPLPWTEEALIHRESTNTIRNALWFRMRVVGYREAQNGEKVKPIYEMEQRIQKTYRTNGRISLTSIFTRFYFYESWNGTICICYNCAHQQHNRYSFSRECICGVRDSVHPIEVDLAYSLGFNDHVYDKVEAPISEELREELMQKTWHPDRKDLWGWTMDLEERKEMGL